MLYAFFYLISRLPFSILYAISDLMAYLANNILGYRKNVILKNLRNSFPARDEQELQGLLPAIYRNLTDVIVETIKLLTISKEELNRRVIFKNTDVIDNFYHQGRTVIATTSHICNWEWLLGASALNLAGPIDAVYQPIKSRFYDDLMLRIRGRFGAVPVEKNNVFRESLKKRNFPHIVALAADQSPPGSDSNVYWTKFLNQETVFYNGMERLASGFDWPVVYGKMFRKKRGYYEVEFISLGTGQEEDKKGSMLDKYAETLEKMIEENPENWLWSHNRWKRQPPRVTG
ncbi:MAG: lysophospholipid acyltransferase family protein [Cyclobacteriaceae bacterium]|nr:lysophospholipid acyltransferase family protein [Cyclobacteriaceae bacterium]